MKPGSNRSSRSMARFATGPRRDVGKIRTGLNVAILAGFVEDILESGYSDAGHYAVKLLLVVRADVLDDRRVVRLDELRFVAAFHGAIAQGLRASVSSKSILGRYLLVKGHIAHGTFEDKDLRYGKSRRVTKKCDMVIVEHAMTMDKQRLLEGERVIQASDTEGRVADVDMPATESET